MPAIMEKEYDDLCSSLESGSLLYSHSVYTLDMNPAILFLSISKKNEQAVLFNLGVAIVLIEGKL